MRWNLTWKGVAVGGISLLLLIPLMMIEGMVQERNQRHIQTRSNIAEGAAGPQRMVGPLLVIPYTEWVSRQVKDEKTGAVKQWMEEVSDALTLVPKTLRVTGNATVEQRYRGLYKAQLYRMMGRMTGDFRIPEAGTLFGGRKVHVKEAFVVMGVSDLRGVRNRPVLQFGGEGFPFESGVAGTAITKGMRANLGILDLSKAQEQAFEIPLDLLGSQDLTVAPVADHTEMTLTSDWATPSFGGRFLPDQREVSSGGFKAVWRVPHLARNLDRILHVDKESSDDFFSGTSSNGVEAFTVSFIEPVNIYLQSERAVKYGFLFVGLSFAVFLLFEMLKGLRIHPIQYFLVGVSLALFFLLVLSLSEHMAFLWAYLVAALASVLLQGTYLVKALRNRALGFGFTAGLGLLYGALYGLIITEDNALLMGSVLLFLLVGGVMLGTRKLDWYGLSRASSPTEG